MKLCLKAILNIQHCERMLWKSVLFFKYLNSYRAIVIGLKIAVYCKINRDLSRDNNPCLLCFGRIMYAVVFLARAVRTSLLQVFLIFFSNF